MRYKDVTGLVFLLAMAASVLVFTRPPAKAPVPEVTHYCPDAQTAYESWAPCDAHSSPVETEI